MTAALVVLTLVSLSLFLAAAIRLGGRSAPSPVVHLLTARQVAEAVGVSVAAVQAWQDDGLLPADSCTACGSASIPADALRPLLDRHDATTPSAAEVARATDAALVRALRALREGDDESIPSGWVEMSRNRWPA